MTNPQSWLPAHLVDELRQAEVAQALGVKSLIAALEAATEGDLFEKQRLDNK